MIEQTRISASQQEDVEIVIIPNEIRELLAVKSRSTRLYRSLLYPAHSRVSRKLDSLSENIVDKNKYTTADNSQQNSKINVPIHLQKWIRKSFIDLILMSQADVLIGSLRPTYLALLNAIRISIKGQPLFVANRFDLDYELCESGSDSKGCKLFLPPDL